MRTNQPRRTKRSNQNKMLSSEEREEREERTKQIKDAIANGSGSVKEISSITGLSKVQVSLHAKSTNLKLPKKMKKELKKYAYTL